MSLTLTYYPVVSTAENILAGKSPIEIKFKREDVAITTIEIGTAGTAKVNVAANLSAALNLGEYVYISSGDYNILAPILEIAATYLRLNTPYLGDSSGGFMNYKQNYFIELELIKPTNELIKVLPFNLTDNGSPNGIITIDLSIVNDLNTIDLPLFSAIYGLTDSSVVFDIKYRELWRDNMATTYTRIENPIVVIPAKEIISNESFTNGFDMPEYYVGYPNGAVYLHSNLATVTFYYDQRDINQDIISTNHLIGEVTEILTGRIFVPLQDLVLEANTYYISLNATAELITEFAPEDFSEDFNIGQ